MFEDILFILRKYSIVHLIGVSKLRERYARSKLGQFWIAFSQFLIVIIFGVVWSVIWNVPVDEHLPYVGVGFILYVLIATTLSDSSGVIIADSKYYINSKIPFMLSIAAHIHRSFLIFFYSVPTIFILVVWSDNASFTPSLNWLISCMSLPLFLIPWCYIIAITSTRLRDTIQIWGLLFQTVFLVSPLMWKLSFIPKEYQNYFLINPIAAYLELIRNPILGMANEEFAVFSVLFWIIFGWLIAFLIKLKYEMKLTVWL